MRKYLISVLAVTMLASCIASTAVFAEPKKAPTPTPNVELTTEQKAELSALYKEKNAVETKILEKYVEFKVLTEEQKAQILDHKAKWFKSLEDNGFVSPHQKPENWKHPKPKF